MLVNLPWMVWTSQKSSAFWNCLLSGSLQGTIDLAVWKINKHQCHEVTHVTESPNSLQSSWNKSSHLQEGVFFPIFSNSMKFLVGNHPCMVYFQYVNLKEFLNIAETPWRNSWRQAHRLATPRGDAQPRRAVGDADRRNWRMVTGVDGSWKPNGWMAEIR